MYLLASLILLQLKGDVMSTKYDEVLQHWMDTSRPDATVSVSLHFKDTERILSAFGADVNPYHTRHENARRLLSHLQDHANAHQAPVLKYLNESTHLHGNRIRSLLLENKIAVQDASRELLLHLDSNLFNIKAIVHDELLPADHPLHHIKSPATVASIESIKAWGRDFFFGEETYENWNIERIQAPDVWKHGVEGAGVTVGIIDTGIRATHEKLGRHRITAWKDAVMGRSEPYDDAFHGTHVAGIIGATDGWGVAPKVDFVICKAFGINQATDSDLAECAEFMLCPDPNSGCSQTPSVINNSWFKESSYDISFSPFIDAWHHVGIVTVFCTGNHFNPQTCADLSIKPPALNHNQVISVGATNEVNALASYSRQGIDANGRATTTGRQPDLVAPGSSIASTGHEKDDGRNTASGTSMAAPHVTGTIALMQSVAANHDVILSTNHIRILLQRSAIREGLQNPEFDCGSSPTFPNAAFGYGLLNTLEAVRSTRAYFGDDNEFFSDASRRMQTSRVVWGAVCVNWMWRQSQSQSSRRRR